MRRVPLLLFLLLPVAGCAGRADPLASRPVPPPVDPVPVRSAPHPPAPLVPLETRVTPRDRPRGEAYLGPSIVASPALGGGLTVGQVVHRSPLATWSVEAQAILQDLETDLYGAGSGTFAAARGTVKASFVPCGRLHPTARAGFAWFRTTGPSDLVATPGDHVGLHAGVGWELEVGDVLRTGPEVSALVVSREGKLDPFVVPQFTWHVIFDF